MTCPRNIITELRTCSRWPGFQIDIQHMRLYNSWWQDDCMQITICNHNKLCAIASVWIIADRHYTVLSLLLSRGEKLKQIKKLNQINRNLTKFDSAAACAEYDCGYSDSVMLFVASSKETALSYWRWKRLSSLGKGGLTLATICT